MQADLDAVMPGVFQIHTVNAIGYDAGLPDLFAISSLPGLQDDSTNNVWSNWGVTYRDVYILDEHNELVAVYNLTTYGLANSSNYQTLYDLFLAAAP
ncbi:MAG TPA: hypothetical protein PKY30_21540 [Myxococcota bacterium]|nr:hypothetical protein [Myxococcota bacterium]HND29116.1 hypothetical protein [Myxococcota bacterium]HNH49642.1 hypothetical protein [Myxococcota bacterium]